MGLELRNGLEAWKARCIIIDLPNVDFPLESVFELIVIIMKESLHTLLLPATKHDPSKATLTDRIGISPAGASVPSRIRKTDGTQQDNDLPAQACMYFRRDPTGE